MVSLNFCSSSSIEIGPGYLCGIDLERVGLKVLHNAKKVTLMAKLIIYEQFARRSYQGGKLDKVLRKHHTLPRLGRLIRESIGLMR
jgi:hypothetical protein